MQAGFQIATFTVGIFSALPAKRGDVISLPGCSRGGGVKQMTRRWVSRISRPTIGKRRRDPEEQQEVAVYFSHFLFGEAAPSFHSPLLLASHMNVRVPRCPSVLANDCKWGWGAFARKYLCPPLVFSYNPAGIVFPFFSTPHLPQSCLFFFHGNPRSLYGRHW